MRADSPPILALRSGLRRWLPALMVLWPLFWLVNTHVHFRSPDWYNHYWLVAYQAAHWQHHGAPAEVLNTNSVVGMPYPVFYGYLYYPALGLLAAIIGVDWALRLVVLLLTSLQFGLCLRLFARVSRDWWLGLLVASATTWATYAMTNLYCRAAITEFVAVSLLTSSSCQLLLAGLEEEKGNRGWRLVQAGFCFAVAAGTHPITAFFGGWFLMLQAMGIVLLTGEWRPMLGIGAVVGMSTLGVLGPWLYATMKFRGDLMVDRMNTKLVGLMFNPVRNDSLLLRLLPFPYDPAMQRSTREMFPYLETQVAVVLLVLAFLLALRALGRRPAHDERRTVRWARRLCISALMLFFLLLVLSVWPTPWQFLPRVVWMLQFAYRLVSYMNLALLVCIFAAALVLRGDCLGQGTRRVVWLGTLFALAVSSLVIKLAHVGAIRERLTVDLRQTAILRLPESFYGYYAYATDVSTPRPIPAEAEWRVSLQPGTSDLFGVVGPVEYRVPAVSTLLVPVQPFPWNGLLLNGASPDPAKTRRFCDGLVVDVAAGDLRIEYRWQPDSVWLVLKTFSWSVLTLWAAIILWRLVSAKWRGRPVNVRR